MPKHRIRNLIKDNDLTSRIVLIVAVLGILFLAIFLSGPKPSDIDEQTLTGATTPIPTLQAKISNLTPEELAEYSNTLGVLAGVIMILMIIELGTLIEIKFNQDDNV